jgi:sulfite exporter TauE/SafE
MKATILFITGILIGALDWFVYSGWMWILEHKSCIIGGVEQICWDMSPIPTFLITGIAIAVTILWAIWIVNDLRVFD